MKSESNKFLLIIDGSSLLATSYYSSLPKRIRREKDEEKKKQLYPKLLHKDKNGHYINALELFFHTLFTILTFQRPTHLVICWDVTRHTFRKDLWESYKANRSETPEPLREQFESAYEICEKLGFVQYRDARFEADDFAGTLASVMEQSMKVRILTRDKDYFQLISDQTKIWYGMSDLDKVREWRRKHQMNTCLPSRVVEIDRTVVQEEFGYLPEALPMIKALSGDASDNIPGVSGIGEVRSMKLAEHYLSPEALYKDIERANTTARKKKLTSRWQQWGIRKSPYSCLTRRATPKRKSAREMADLCYILGTIRRDIDLSEYSGCLFSEDLLRIELDWNRHEKILAEYEIRLQIGRRKKPGSAQVRPKQAMAAQRKSSAEAAENQKQTGRASSKNQKPARKKRRQTTRKPEQISASQPQKGKNEDGQAQIAPALLKAKNLKEQNAGSADALPGQAKRKRRSSGRKIRKAEPAGQNQNVEAAKKDRPQESKNGRNAVGSALLQQSGVKNSAVSEKSENSGRKNNSQNRNRKRRRPSKKNWENRDRISPVLQQNAQAVPVA